MTQFNFIIVLLSFLIITYQYPIAIDNIGDVDANNKDSAKNDLLSLLNTTNQITNETIKNTNVSTTTTNKPIDNSNKNSSDSINNILNFLTKNGSNSSNETNIKKDKIPSEDDFINELSEIIDESESSNEVENANKKDNIESLVGGEKLEENIITSSLENPPSFCPSGNIEFCECENKCSPLKVLSMSPCLCEQYDNFPPISQQLPLEDDKTSIQKHSAINKCPPGDSKCSCSASCSPYAIRSYEPCSCDFKSDANSKLAPMPSSNGQCAVNDHACSCKRDCYPYVVDQSIPCSCNYNKLMNRETVDQYTDPIFQISNIEQNEQSLCAKSCNPFKVLSEDPCICNIIDNPMTQIQQNSPETLYDPTMIQPPVFDNNVIDDKINMIQIPDQPQSNQINNQPPSKHLVEAGGWYLGCYHDKEIRDLKIKLPISLLTPDKCVIACRAIDQKFAAVQYSYLCFCGSKFGRYGKADESKCSSPCQGNNNTYCGGSWFNSVYSTDGKGHETSEFDYNEPDNDLELQFKMDYPQSKAQKSVEEKISSESNLSDNIINEETTNEEINEKTDNNQMEKSDIKKNDKKDDNKEDKKVNKKDDKKEDKNDEESDDEESDEDGESDDDEEENDDKSNDKNEEQSPNKKSELTDKIENDETQLETFKSENNDNTEIDSSENTTETSSEIEDKNTDSKDKNVSNKQKSKNKQTDLKVDAKKSEIEQNDDDNDENADEAAKEENESNNDN